RKNLRLEEKKKEEKQRLKEQRIKEEEARAIEEEQERQIALKKAEEKKQLAIEKVERAKLEAEKARLLKQEEERRLWERNSAKEKEALKKQRIKIFLVSSLVSIVVLALIITLITTIQNRNRQETLEAESLYERLSLPYGKFVSYFFVFNDSEIIEIQALPGRKIKTPDNSDRARDYMVSTWSTEAPEPERFHSIRIPESFTSDDAVHTALPGEEIKMGTTKRVYYASLDPVPHRIRFDGNGVKGFEREVELPYSSQYTIPNFPGPEPDGMEFLGWSSSKTGDPENAYYPGETIIMPANDITMYALWRPTEGISIHPILYLLTVPGQFVLIIVVVFFTSNI
ncbi:MAG: hypothetical protein EOM67_17080, partial [Spirochaetia bacterium]|nr:hypothetical protein [Spirochaetia bacterium]